MIDVTWFLSITIWNNNVVAINIQIKCSTSMYYIYIRLYNRKCSISHNWYRFLARTQEKYETLENFLAFFVMPYVGKTIAIRRNFMSTLKKSLTNHFKNLETLLHSCRDIWLSHQDMFIWHYILIMMDSNIVISFHRFLEIARTWKYASTTSI